ncbi:hypothetical protein GCM10027443_33040 [Pontibacter brevis]
MPELLFYLLKVNVVLLLFYLAYHVVLRRLTFYHLNRLFLVFAILFSTLYPFIDVSELFSQQVELAAANIYVAAIPTWTVASGLPEQTATFDYWLIPLILFWLSTALMAARLLLQFVSLHKIHHASEPAAHSGIGFRKVSGISEPFSLWQTIYLNPSRHKTPELESILRHEQIHVKGWHTLDVLLAELSTVFYWFNPGVWLMKKAIKENLEFIADQHVMSAGVDRKEYQYLLLNATSLSAPQLANQFNFPSLKRRIAMMNKKQTSLMYVARYAVLVPLIVAPLLLIACSEEDAGMMPTGVTAGSTKEQHDMSVEGDIIPHVHVYLPEASSAPEDYKAFLKRNPEIKQVGWEIRVTDGSPEINIFMYSESLTGDMYDINDEKSVSAAEAKYGELPALPAAAAKLTKESSFEVIPDVEI